MHTCASVTPKQMIILGLLAFNLYLLYSTVYRRKGRICTSYLQYRVTVLCRINVQLARTQSKPVLPIHLNYTYFGTIHRSALVLTCSA
jgi:hypothetical protein